MDLVCEFVVDARAAGYEFVIDGDGFSTPVKPAEEVRQLFRERLAVLAVAIPNVGQLIHRVLTDGTADGLAATGEEGDVELAEAAGKATEGRPPSKASDGHKLKPGTFVKAPLELLYEADLSNGEFRLFLHILNRSAKTGKFWEGRQATAAAFGVSTKTVQRQMGQLESKGFLRPIGKHPSGTTLYKVIRPKLIGE